MIISAPILVRGKKLINIIITSACNGDECDDDNNNEHRKK